MVEYIVIALLFLIIVILVLTRPKVITIEDYAPKEISYKNNWLKLQNEGAKYVKVKDGKVELKIVKEK